MNFGPCPKCGLMQIIREKCQSCGKPLNGPRAAGHVKSTKPPGPERPPVNAGSSPGERVSPPPIPEPSTLAGDESAVPPDAFPKNTEQGESRKLSFAGKGGELFGIQLVNIFLTIVTLGIYKFWGKTRVRNYLWSQTELEGERFAYHGTGRELMIGFSKVMLLFAVPVMLLNVLPRIVGPNSIMRIVTPVLTFSLVMAVFPMAVVGFRRYLLTRTSWRGIRFSFRGQVKDFAALFLGGSLLTAITLGLYYPFFDVRRQGFMVNNAYFGNHSFTFDGNGRDLFKPFLVALLLSIPTLGLSWVWYMAARQRYLWEHTRLDDVRFSSTVTAGGLLGLYAGNFLLLLVTLGLAWSWVVVRSVNFAFSYLTLEGTMDLAKVRQEAQTASATGDVLGDVMDAGFDLGY
jgi:uncharacterized membrane protein YjgN (DUF898 family)